MHHIKRTLLFISIVLLFSGCSLFGTVETVDPVTVKVQHSSVRLPVFYAPEKPILDPIKLDWPRDQSKLDIKNSAVCKSEYKKLYGSKLLPMSIDTLDGKNAKFWDKCVVPSVDQSSNLYIGLDLENYKNLVNNQKVLILREKRWNQTLKNINDMIQGLYPDKPNSTDKTPTKPTE